MKVKEGDALGKGREPACERERLAAVSSEVASLVVLDEAQIEPRDEPAELDLCVVQFPTSISVRLMKRTEGSLES